MRSRRVIMERLRALRRDALTVFQVARHPQTPWPAKLVALTTVAYILSPIDLIPDFIPLLGYLDELVLVPIAISIILRLTPAEVVRECRQQAAAMTDAARPRSWVGACMVLSVWLVLCAVLFRLLWPR